MANARPTSRGRAFCVFVPFGAEVGTDGGRLTSRSLPPSIFLGYEWDSQGTSPLSGCGQSPPFPPRDGRGETGAAGGGERPVAPDAPAAKGRKARAQRRLSAQRTTTAKNTGNTPKRRIPVPRRARHLFFKGRPPRKQLFPVTRPKPARHTRQRLCPNGANSVEYARPQRPLPAGQGSVAQTPRRRQAPAREPAAVDPFPRSKRSETQNARPLLMGRAFAAHPRQLRPPAPPARGSAGRRHCRRRTQGLPAE